MMFFHWFIYQLKRDFTWKKFVLLFSIDLFASNVGFFLGMITTIILWISRFHSTTQAFFIEMVFKAWLPNILILSLCCFLGYALNGCYRESWDRPYLERFLHVSRAVGTALLLFLLTVYITKPFLPRSMLITGWFIIFFLILSIRLFGTAFLRRYRLTSVDTYNREIKQVLRDLAVIQEQDGWVPPEELSSKSSWPYFDDDEVAAAAIVLQSGKVNQWTGSEVKKFQEEFATFCGVGHGVALANGSVALDLALNAIEIGHGDEVIVTPRTFVASVSCVALRGAKPVFVDVDPYSQNITAESIRKAITTKTRAIIAVHLAGWPCDMDPIMALAEEHNLKVIEDCSQCHGAVYYSKHQGKVPVMKDGAPIEQNGVRLYPRVTGSLGHMAIFSFCQDKIMTTGGEGGMLVTDDEMLWKKAWAFKDHGKSYDAVYHRQHPQGFRWIHESFGTNLRMTEMQAAIGRRQLNKLPKWLAARRSNAAILNDMFSPIEALRITIPPNTIQHAYYKYYAFVNPDQLKPGWNRDRVMSAVVNEGTPCFSGSCSEVYLEKAFSLDGMRPIERLPVARELGETSLMFLVHPTLSARGIRDMAGTVVKIMEEARR